jgi:hypothetical protein
MVSRDSSTTLTALDARDCSLTIEPALIVAEAVVAVRQAQQSALLPVDVGLGVLQDLADRLGELGQSDPCPRELGRTLLSCRDLLASHIHAARTLGEVRVRDGVTHDLLVRGLAEVKTAIAAL